MLHKPTTYAKPLLPIRIHSRTEAHARWFSTTSQAKGDLIKEDGMWFARVDGCEATLRGGANKSARAAAEEALAEWEADQHA